MNQTNSTEAGPVTVVEQETNDEELTNVYNRLKRVFNCWINQLSVSRDNSERHYNVRGVSYLTNTTIERVAELGFILDSISIPPFGSGMEINVYDNLPTILDQD